MEEQKRQEEAEKYKYDDYYDEEDPYGEEVANPKVVSLQSRAPGSMRADP